MMRREYVVDVVVEPDDVEEAARVYAACFNLGVRDQEEHDGSVVLEYDDEFALRVTSRPSPDPEYIRGETRLVGWKFPGFASRMERIRAHGFEVIKEYRDRASGEAYYVAARGPYGHVWTFKDWNAPPNDRSPAIQRLQKRPHFWRGPESPIVLHVVVDPAVLEEAAQLYHQAFGLRRRDDEADESILLEYKPSLLLRVTCVPFAERYYERGKTPRVAWQVPDLESRTQRLESQGFDVVWEDRDPESGDLVKVHLRGPFHHIWGLWDADRFARPER